MRRGDIYWADIPAPVGKRPVLVLTRDEALAVRTRVTVALISRRLRVRRCAVAVGAQEGLPVDSFVNCDDIQTISAGLCGGTAIGRLSAGKLRALDRALRYALGIRS